MKILHVVPSMGRNDGGVGEYVPMAALAQKRAGLDVAIAFYDVGELSSAACEAEREGVLFIRFKGSGTRWNPMAVSLDFLHRFEMFARDYDVIHTHAQWMFPIWWAAHVARKLGIRLFMTPHGSFAPERLKISKWKKRIVGLIDRRCVRQSDRVWAMSPSEASDIMAYEPRARVETLPIGMDAGKFTMSRQTGHTLLYLSRISPVKGLDMLAEAWGRVAGRGGAGEWKIVVAGPDDRGYAEEAMKAFAKKCPAGSYEFRGPVYGEGKYRLLSEADAFVLPTRNENWGIAVAEAMASGLPVICTKGAPWRCLETACAGWWTDISEGGLASALEELVATSRDERLAMGARGRKWVDENLDWRKIGNAMRLSYERLRDAL